MQQHRYEKDQFYKPHHDYFSDTVSYDFHYTSPGHFFSVLMISKSQSICSLFLFWQFNLKRGGQRIATMLMYLSDNVEGGETYFPMVMTNGNVMLKFFFYDSRVIELIFDVLTQLFLLGMSWDAQVIIALNFKINWFFSCYSSTTRLREQTSITFCLSSLTKSTQTNCKRIFISYWNSPLMRVHPAAAVA